MSGLSGSFGLAALNAKAQQLCLSIDAGDFASAGQCVLEIRGYYEKSLREISALAD